LSVGRYAKSLPGKADAGGRVEKARRPGTGSAAGGDSPTGSRQAESGLASGSVGGSAAECFAPGGSLGSGLSGPHARMQTTDKASHARTLEIASGGFNGMMVPFYHAEFRQVNRQTRRRNHRHPGMFNPSIAVPI